jgi:alpha-beta hydrolase superfamily lysophospholipase
MTDQLESFVDRDDVTVVYRRWPVDEPRGAVVVAHGASEHSGRYGRFAAALNDAGWTVLAPDHRGHGATAESSGRGQTGPRGMDGVLDDLDEVVRRARDAAGDGPVVLFGHSMGSIIALRYAEVRDGGLAALALSGPLGVMPGVQDALTQLNVAVEAGMADQPMDALGAFNAAFEPARTPFDWLSRDEAEVDKYIADPFCGNNLPLTYGYVAAMFAAIDSGARDVATVPATLHVLLTAGELDPVGGRTVQVRALADLLRSSGVRVTERYYPDARHEILNETNRDEVQADIVRWIEDQGS